MRLGIDVGGTHTDIVLVNGSDVLLSHKTLTTSDVTTGVKNALAYIQDQQADMHRIRAVMIGTTQFTNAVVQRRDLDAVAGIRIGLPSGRGLPPKTGWPEDIADTLGHTDFMLHGGYLYTGELLAPLDETEIDKVIADLTDTSVRAVAITSAFSPMNAGPETHIARRLRDAFPDLAITQSHKIGRVGLLERENAALLNASLLRFADKVVGAFEAAIKVFGLTCPVYISQNDGTLMEANFVRANPALTFSSGPTNSLRGAAQLTGKTDAIVVDIGGTTSDVGVLKNGFPRQSNMVVEVGGVRTNFRMPDILAVGLGGGSIVSENGRKIGPQSVGHNLVTQARVFGGDTLTATDIVVAAGQADVGDRARVQDLPAELIQNGLETIRSTLDQAIRTMKPNKAPMPVILVGGGAILAPQNLETASTLETPNNSGVANAIGAALSLIGGEAERFVDYTQQARTDALAEVTDLARHAAVSAGASPDTVRVTDIEETAIPYMDEGANRIRVKVVGEIASLENA